MAWTCSVDDDFTLTPEQHAEMSAVASNTMSEANALMRDMLAITERTELPDLAKVYALGAALLALEPGSQFTLAEDDEFAPTLPENTSGAVYPMTWPPASDAPRETASMMPP